MFICIISGITVNLKNLNYLPPMKSPIMILLLLVCCFFSGCQENSHKICESNNIRDYLIRSAAAISDSSLAGISSLRDWQNIRNMRYQELVEMLGLQDMLLQGNRSPLNVKVTGTIQENGYHIEKLYYESLPGLYVRANLYIPENRKGPMPSILYVCGHSPTQKVHYQAHPSKFASLGFVCLIIETIQFGEVQGHHWGPYSEGWFNWYSRGYNPAGVEVWNGIRGLDLLIGRSEVDPEKIGVTGISGGGSQSWYLGAVDPRIRAVAPVCGASTLKAQITSRTIDGHCDCMMPINTYRQDFADIGALIAPRPLLICQADRDGLNTIESVRELHSSISKIYKLYNEPGKLGLVETPGGHSYHKISRERIFSFFLKHLMDKDIAPEQAGDIDTLEQNWLSGDDLKVYKNGPPTDDRTASIQDSFIVKPAPPYISGENELNAFSDSVRNFLKVRTFGAFPIIAPDFSKKLEFRTLDGARHGEDIYSFVSENGWRLKVDLFWAHRPDSMNPVTIILRNYNDERWAAEAFASQISKNRNIAYFETRGVGEFGWAPELQWHVRRASAWTGRTIASMQVYDLLRCMEYLRTLPGVDPSKISIAARNEAGVIALYAALMDGRCEKVILKDPPESQDVVSKPYGMGPSTEMLNCLRITDVYQIPALISPATVEFIGVMPDAYRWSVDVLKKTGRQEPVILPD
jgi:cephalosporin-C deacetylase-like acetyl esterase